MAQDNSDNGGLYFLVGGLLVAVIALGFMFYTDTDSMQSDSPTIIERTVTQDESGNSGSFNMDITDDGVSVSSESEEN